MSFPPLPQQMHEKRKRRVGESWRLLTLVCAMLDLQEERDLLRARKEVRLGSVHNGKATLTVLISTHREAYIVIVAISLESACSLPITASSRTWLVRARWHAGARCYPSRARPEAPSQQLRRVSQNAHRSSLNGIA